MSDKFLLVASDIHSDCDAFEYLAQIAKDPDCLAFLYAGDLDVENYFIGTELRNRNFVFLPVLGNCDYPFSYSSSDVPVPTNYRTCTYNDVKIFITHGHLYSMPSDVGLKNEDFDIVINGHTHIPQCERVDNLTVLNPGSAARPRGFSAKSYAKIVFNDQKYQVQFERIPDLCSH